MDSTKKRILLIDADILMFRFAFRNQETIDWGNGIVSETLDFCKAKRDVNNFIKSLLRKTNCKKYHLCFTHKINFRYSVFPKYKANREQNIPPKLLNLLKEFMFKNHSCKSWKFLEADDLMGILGTGEPDKYVLTTIDKDFESLPVILFNWDKDETPRLISKHDADYYFHYQWLKGDSGDGFKGCNKIGDKKARAILNSVSPEDWTKIVVETYANKCYSWKEILQQAQMARILRHTDYNFKTKEPILWNPNC